MSNIANRVHLIGHLGKDPEINEFEGGKKKVQFSIATNEYYKNDKGDRIETTDWHLVVAWGKLADFCGENLKKGRKVALEGKLTSRSYDGKDGQKKFITEVIAQEILLLQPKPEEKD